MEECFLHRNSVANKEKLVALSSVDGWKTILNAGRIRGCEKVIALAATTNAGDFPNIKFHKTCRGLFTMKKDLEKLKKRKPAIANRRLERMPVQNHQLRGNVEFWRSVAYFARLISIFPIPNQGKNYHLV